MNTETATPTYPLACDLDGNPIQLPTNATAWRVRKLAAKAGRPKLIYDNETGLPLELPLTASIQQLAEAVSEDGRFRLEAIDRKGRAIPNCVAVTAFELPEEEPTPIAPSNMMEQLMCRLIESNTRVTEALASRFAAMPPPDQAPQQVVEPAPSAANPFGNTAGAAEVLNQVLTQILARFAQPNAAAAPAAQG